MLAVDEEPAEIPPSDDDEVAAELAALDEEHEEDEDDDAEEAAAEAEPPDEDEPDDETDEDIDAEAPDDPNAQQALLVRARDRRRQDRRRGRLRRGLAHRRRPDPHPPPQPRRPVHRRDLATAATRSACAPPLLDGRDHADGPVTVETYQWFVRNAGQISDAYTIVICDEAHTALGEKTSACDPRAGPARSSSA